jgi:hypothetical protein
MSRGFLLVGASEALAGNSWRIPADGLIIGREAGFCDICLPSSASSVSRQHARVSLAPDEAQVLVEDLGSKNGTWVPSVGWLTGEAPFVSASEITFWLGTPDWSFTIVPMNAL